MLKTVFAVFLLALGVICATFTGRFYIVETYLSVKFYFKLSDGYKAEPLCHAGESYVGPCIEKIVLAAGGYRFIGEFAFTALFLQRNLPATYTSLASSLAMTRMLEPNNLWIGKVRTKTAKNLFKEEKKKLLTIFTKQRMRFAKKLKIAEASDQREIYLEFVNVLDEKIAKLSI